jgi:hypothetical protein
VGGTTPDVVAPVVAITRDVTPASTGGSGLITLIASLLAGAALLWPLRRRGRARKR